MKKITRATYIAELGKIVNQAYRLADNSHIKNINKLYASNLAGRLYIPQSITLPVIVKLYEEVINYCYDNRLEIC